MANPRRRPQGPLGVLLCRRLPKRVLQAHELASEHGDRTRGARSERRHPHRWRGRPCARRLGAAPRRYGRRADRSKERCVLLFDQPAQRAGRGHPGSGPRRRRVRRSRGSRPDAPAGPRRSGRRRGDDRRWALGGDSRAAPRGTLGGDLAHRTRVAHAVGRRSGGPRAAARARPFASVRAGGLPGVRRDDPVVHVPRLRISAAARDHLDRLSDRRARGLDTRPRRHRRR